MSMALRITLKGHIYSAKLSEEALRQLTEHCPFEEAFVRSGNHEYYCRLRNGLDVNGLQDTKKVHRNGIYYFAAWNALSFVYRDENIAPYQVTYLGEFPEEMSALLEKAGSNVTVSLEVSE